LHFGAQYAAKLQIDHVLGRVAVLCT